MEGSGAERLRHAGNDLNIFLHLIYGMCELMTASVVSFIA